MNTEYFKIRFPNPHDFRDVRMIFFGRKQVQISSDYSILCGPSKIKFCYVHRAGWEAEKIHHSFMNQKPEGKIFHLLLVQYIFNKREKHYFNLNYI